MRRSEIIEGTQQVLEAIEESKIFESFEAIMQGREKSQSYARDVMQSIKKYFIKTQKFNSFARQIVSIFDLDGLCL